MKKIGIHLLIRRWRNHGRDFIESRISNPTDDVFCWRPMVFESWANVIEPCAIRWCRLYRKDTVKDFCNVAERLAHRWSGSPANTLKSIMPPYWLRPSRKVIFRDGLPVWLRNRIYHKDESVLIAWSRFRIDAKWRLVEMRNRAQKRVEIENSTCDWCGVFEPETQGMRGVQFRWAGLVIGDHKNDFPKLCLSCWNKAKPMCKAAREAKDIQKSIKQIKETIKCKRTPQAQSGPHSRKHLKEQWLAT